MENENLSVTGKIIHVLPEKSGTTSSQKDYTIQYFVIVTDDKYPKNVCFQAYNKGLDLKHDDKVKVFFNPESKEYNGKWFSNLSVWKIEKV